MNRDKFRELRAIKVPFRACPDLSGGFKGAPINFKQCLSHFYNDQADNDCKQYNCKQPVEKFLGAEVLF